MRILIVSFRFPPFNSIGAVRISKFATFLEGLGAEVRVITANGQGLPTTLPVEIDESQVIRLNYREGDQVLRKFGFSKGDAQPVASNTKSSPGLKSRAKQLLARSYVSFFHWPDNKRAWIKEVQRAADELVKEWRPDVIFASGHPLSSLVAASKVAKRHRIPWVGELRDPWVDNHYALRPHFWRHAIDVKWEADTVKSAASWVVVSDFMKEELIKRCGREVHVIFNGFDAKDFPSEDEVESDPKIVNVVYTGEIYAGKRDPRPFLEGIALMPEADRAMLKVHFYGRDHSICKKIAAELGLQSVVEIHEPVTYKESLHIQAAADVLLLLTMNHPSERGVYTGKLFEYLGARRPILVLGAEDGGAATLVRERGIGQFARDAATVSRILTEWVREKVAHGSVKRPDASVSEQFSRQKQATALYELLKSAVEKP